MPNPGMAEAALFYHTNWNAHVIPVKGKRPTGPGWGAPRLTEDELRAIFAEDPSLGLGIALGTPSNSLVDVDLDFQGVDYAKAYRLAETFLPPTTHRFGRPSKPNSHWLYYCARTPASTEQCKASMGMVIELRSTGGQTVFPPSTHISGEAIDWDPLTPGAGGPTAVELEDLRRGVYKTALAVSLLALWPVDGHQSRVELCGWLAFMGWKEAEVFTFVSAIMEARGHGDDDVAAAVGSTFHRQLAGEPNRGFPALKNTLNLDKTMTGALRRWEAKARPAGAKPLGDDITLTDYGVAEPISFDCMDDLRFCPEQESWYVFDKKVWRVDDAHQANVHVVENLRKIKANLPPEDEKVRNKKLKMLYAMETSSKTHSILTFMESGDLMARVDQFDAHPWLLNCQNGILDLNSGTIERHTPSKLQVSITAAEYNPAADAPVFDKFLSEMLPDDEVRGFVQRLFGYCLTGLTREHIFPIFHGPGANGKSTLLGSLMDMMGTYAGPIPSAVVTMSRNKQDRHPTELAAFFKKRLAVTSESEQGKRLDESAVKMLTGGDTISVRQMREDPWDMRPTHKLILMTNYVPQVWGHDEGIWRRLIFIPCEVRFEGKRDNKNLREQLKGEFSGILNWCIAGLKQYRARGLDVPECLVAHGRDYRESQDEVLPFLDEKYIITGEPTDRVPTAELYVAYQTWCTLQGAETLSAKSLAPQYRGYGLRQYRTKTTVYWSGLRAKTKEELDDKGEKL